MPRRPTPPASPPGGSGPSPKQVVLIAAIAVAVLIVGVLLVTLIGKSRQEAAGPVPAYVPPSTPTPPPVRTPASLPDTSPAAPQPPPLVLTRPLPPASSPVTPPAAKPPVVLVPVPQRPAKPVQHVQMQLGNPSGANRGMGNANNYLMLKPYFALSYNDSRGTPNWVSWRVTFNDIAGSAKRKSSFDTDKTLPPGFLPVTTKMYVGGGFDRGHMCPHSDRDANLESSYATFVMTNIVPQSPNNNQRAWAELEEYARGLITGGVHACVIAGPAGRGGEGKNGRADTIANGRVAVPAWTWKVIVVVPPGGGQDADRIDADSRVIAVIMPNDQSVGEDWRRYLCTVADVEKLTGYTFFDTLPGDVAAALRAKRDNGGRN